MTNSAAQLSLHYRLATMHWCAQSCCKDLTLTAAFELSSRADECVHVCRQAREQAWKEHSCRKGRLSVAAESLYSSPKLVSTSQSISLLSLSHDDIWHLDSFLNCQEAFPDFGKREEILAWGLAPSLAGKGSCSCVHSVLDLSSLLLYVLLQGSLATTTIWALPWVFKSILHTMHCAGEGSISSVAWGQQWSLEVW